MKKVLISIFLTFNCYSDTALKETELPKLLNGKIKEDILIKKDDEFSKSIESITPDHKNTSSITKDIKNVIMPKYDIKTFKYIDVTNNIISDKDISKLTSKVNFLKNTLKEKKDKMILKLVNSKDPSDVSGLVETLIKVRVLIDNKNYKEAKYKNYLLYKSNNQFIRVNSLYLNALIFLKTDKIKEAIRSFKYIISNFSSSSLGLKSIEELIKISKVHKINDIKYFINFYKTNFS